MRRSVVVLVLVLVVSGVAGQIMRAAVAAPPRPRTTGGDPPAHSSTGLW